MADVALSVTVSRDSLGLPPLEIAFGGRYYLAAAQFLGGQVTWTRTQVTSPYVDGQITTQRMRQNVTETIGVEVRAETHVQLQAYIEELLAAFLQDSYTLSIVVDGGSYSYRCEAADYQALTWNTSRLVSLQGQVLFQVPRQPAALAGGI